MINNNIVTYKTLDQITKHFNTTRTRKIGNILQIQDYDTKLFHYLVENTQGWVELPMTSIRGYFAEEK